MNTGTTGANAPVSPIFISPEEALALGLYCTCRSLDPRRYVLVDEDTAQAWRFVPHKGFVQLLLKGKTQ